MDLFRFKINYFVASQCRCLWSTLGGFPPFRGRGMTCRDDRVDGVLNLIVNRAAN